MFRKILHILFVCIQIVRKTYTFCFNLFTNELFVYEITRVRAGLLRLDISKIKSTKYPPNYIN